MDELQRRLVTRIREIAAKRKIPVTHLPDRAGVARSHFWEVLNGNRSPTLTWIGKVAKALRADPVELFRRPEPREPKSRARR